MPASELDHTPCARETRSIRLRPSEVRSTVLHAVSQRCCASARLMASVMLFDCSTHAEAAAWRQALRYFVDMHDLAPTNAWDLWAHADLQ